MYIVTNGNHYLKTNTKLTSHINEAKKFPNIALAEKSKIGMKRTFKKMGICQFNVKKRTWLDVGMS